ncbi:prephenate dehydrogenase [Acutalibacter sp. JLR.KK004]|jgi:prephenate dehydrogenase|uniref:prephenate dehydrogenase n=1 Tax=Acutalibacter sp. JLR.KK004 TaxID=3112622 RepID=UPI00216E6486|nr:prephenate dehydrogenase [Acutalibacter sp.]
MSAGKDIVVVGLGLIGGSIAKALKQRTSHRVYGIDRDEGALLDACSCGAIDGKAGPAELARADVVYLCVYPQGALAFMEAHGSALKENCIVTDACGIKAAVCAGMEKLAHKGRYVFVAGHPMAGKEKSGFAASDPSIFMGASYLIAPCAAPEWAVGEVEALALSMGFGQIVRTTPEHHDRMIAYTSQVPHVLACAYVLSPRCKDHRGFSAGSYRDVSRVADINHALWARLFLDNREPLTEELDQLIGDLSRFRQAIAAGEEEPLQALLRKAGDAKRENG